MITCYMGAIAQLGLQGAINLAKENGDNYAVAPIQSLIDAGMTQQDIDDVISKKWNDNDPCGSVKSKVDYCKTWYWRGCVIANQVIFLEDGRVTVMQGVTPERLQAAAEKAAAEKAAKAAAFKELKQSAEALYGVEVVKKI